ncbi:hypothetical protein HCZ18_01530 [Limosilactobacillus fermentum]|uniref:hypothetical protein n=1 Tax=Limosilactobacillus fermentum TaxID=1613 RepID=UPI00143347C9|nr:hypothetical protein [Limosilactobacillus fermentum]
MYKATKLIAISALTLSTVCGATLAVNQPAAQVQTVKAAAKETTLGSGTYKVGTDIKPGRYVITSQSGSGNMSDSENMNIILGDTVDDDSGQVTSYTTYLPKGDKVKIDGIEAVNFKPVTGRSYKTTLSAGSWVVGKDIKPGRYTIKCTERSGNLASDDGDINEIIGTSTDEDSGQVTKTTQTLHRGEVLTCDAQQIQLIKK